MERHFTLPIAIAAALHAGLLLGIPHPPPKSVTKIIEKPLPRPPLPPEIEVFLAPRTAAEEKSAPAKAPPDEPRPIQPEPVPSDAKPDFPIPVPPVPPVQPDRVVTRISGFGPGAIAGVPGGGDGDRPSIIDGRFLDSPPRTRVQVPPQYPHEQRTRGTEGEVTVEFVVDESGAVLAPRVVRSSERAFEEPTLRAIARWRFEPGKRGGKIVRFRMAVPVVFKLDSD